MIVQKIKTTDSTDYSRARKYFATISSLNSLSLSNMELNLLAFVATTGCISNSDNKQSFCTKFDSTKYSVNNTIHQLKKKGFLVKAENKVNIPKQLALDFSSPIILQITLDEG